MNQIFEFRKELNIKKLVIVIIVAIAIILGIIFAASHISKKEEEKIEAEKPNKTFYSADKSISLDFLKTYEFKQYNPQKGYLIELRTPNNLNIFVAKKDLLSGKSLYDIASADLKTYINEFTNYSNISELNEFDYNENKAYTYSLHYLSSKTPYYLQTIWIETANAYYTLDIEFPLDDLNNYTNIINDTINSFKIY